MSGVSAPQIRGLDESASGIGQAKSPTLVGLAHGGVPQSQLFHESIALLAFMVGAGIVQA